MNRFVNIFAISMFLLLGAGCSWIKPYTPPMTQGVLIEPDKLDQLQEGLSKDQVRALLGPPFGADPFDPRIWDYVLDTNQPELKKKYVGHLRLWFDKEGYLVKWQRLDQGAK